MTSNERTKTPPRPQTPYDFSLLKTLRYEDASSGKPPRYAAATEESPQVPAVDTAPPSAPETTPSTTLAPTESNLATPVKRDSGLDPADETSRRPSFSASSGLVSTTTYQKPALPAIVVQDETPPSSRRSSNSPFARRRKNRDSSAGSPPTKPGGHQRLRSFHGMSVDIPSGDLDDLMSPEFSNRGSMLLGSEKMEELLASEGQAVKQDNEEPQPQGLRTGRRKPSVQMLQAAIDGGRILSADEMTFSMRVRSMYDNGDENATDWKTSPANGGLRAMSPEAEMRSIDRSLRSPTPEDDSLHVDKMRQAEGNGSLRPFSPTSTRQSYTSRDQHEIAGGIEDWQDVEGRDVDRFGFINPSRVFSRDSSNGSTQIAVQPGMQRVSTSLQLLSNNPRRKRTIRKAQSSRSVQPTSRDANSLRARGSLYSFRSTNSSIFETSPFRSRNRRLMDEASDMLTLPPGLADIAEQEDAGRTANMLKRREWTREEKWQKMARVVSRGARGGGMSFDFDTRDPRVIQRTWKGIPDRWRATAWHAFLSASAKRRGGCLSDDELITRFHESQEENSADDVQIDVDVPRTISMHIMFRRRYRGGQRLLFRVLHAISIQFPDTGYVQGMASLAATLLCYYDEEKAFVMLVRLWQLRGLEVLFRSGFDGLMAALDQFETEWLGQGAVALKLKDLGITSTAYGTRWYLTLFNMSIPFPAQLRVWDVFMLLGDEPVTHSPRKSPRAGEKVKEDFGGADLDVLHAASAALVDATRDIILDSDFENAMKVLTSWIPVKDEDLLMRVAKAEYKAKKKRTKA